MPAGAGDPGNPAAARLAQLCEALEQLAALLQTELDTLTRTHDPSSIERIAAHKGELCARIESLQSEQADVAAGEPRLRELARQVAQANQRNGVVLAALIRNTRGALDILRAVPGAEVADVYGPRGRSLGTGSAKPLGSA